MLLLKWQPGSSAGPDHGRRGLVSLGVRTRSLEERHDREQAATVATSSAMMPEVKTVALEQGTRLLSDRQTVAGV